MQAWQQRSAELTAHWPTTACTSERDRRSDEVADQLGLNAATDKARSLAQPKVRLDIDRSFDSAQWHWMTGYWDREFAKTQLPSPPQPSSGNASERGRRLRTADCKPEADPTGVELGSTTGLRPQEQLTTRQGALQHVLVDGQAVWLLKVIGKGSREREVVVFDDIVELIRGRLQDRKDAGADRPSLSRGLRALASWEAAPSPAPPNDDTLQPLVGILREPAATSAAPSAAWPGSTSPGGLAAADDVSPTAMKAAMGHSALVTTSIHLRPERKLLVAEREKLKRRT